MDSEERWEYCEVILRDLGLTIDRNDMNLVGLMDLLGGHPLSMRIILPRLERLTASQVAAALYSNLTGINSRGDEAQAKLNSTLQFVQQSLPTELRPLLMPLGMHEGHVAAEYLEAMAKMVDEHWTRHQIDAFINTLVSAGLLRNLGPDICELHPLLTSYLRSIDLQDSGKRALWAHAFVDVMAILANQLTPLELHQQSDSFRVFEGSFYYALLEADRLRLLTPIRALSQSLGRFAEISRNFVEAFRLYERLLQENVRAGDVKGEGKAYHLMGSLARAQRDFVAAEKWYRKSLEIDQGSATVSAQPKPTISWATMLTRNATLRRRRSGITKPLKSSRS